MEFAAATKIQRKDSHTYTASLHPEWVIGSVPHGGYVTAMFLCVVRKHFETTLRQQKQPHTLALHLDFLRRTQVGAATFVVKDVKLGRQTSIVHVALTQDSREEVVGYITNSNLATETGASFPTNWSLSSPPPQSTPSSPEQLLADADPHWAEKREWPNERFRKATHQIRAWFPRNGQPRPSVSDQWMCFRNPDSRWTNEALGYLVDMFPQILETFLLDGIDPYHPRLDDAEAAKLQQLTRTKAPFWYPTLLLNLEVKKALPPEGVRFLFTRVLAKAIANGRYDLEVVVLDMAGEVVALSHHVCFAVSTERNVAARRKTEDGGKL